MDILARLDFARSPDDLTIFDVQDAIHEIKVLRAAVTDAVVVIESTNTSARERAYIDLSAYHSHAATIRFVSLKVLSHHA